jgi:hypothetical protein
VKTCKTCKHWTKTISWPDHDEGVCTKLPDFDFVEVDVFDGGIVNEFITREDFGCILHEEANDER